MIIPFLLIGPHDPGIVWKLRKQSAAPIIVMGEDDPAQIAIMLLAGADHYIPNGMPEKARVARIQAVLRRS